MEMLALVHHCCFSQVVWWEVELFFACATCPIGRVNMKLLSCHVQSILGGYLVWMLAILGRCVDIEC